MTILMDSPSVFISCPQKFPPRVEQRKATTMVFKKGVEERGLFLQSQEGQDLCASAAAEKHIFNTSSEHQTVHLSNKCTTKDFLRDFRHGCTVCGGQEDHTFDMQLQVHVKVQTSDDTCEGVYTAKHHNENTREPS